VRLKTPKEKMKFKVSIFLLCLFINTRLFSEIKILYSAALLKDGYQVRKGEYIEGIKILNRYGYRNPYIVEAIKKKGPTFLDKYSTHVFYAQSNNAALRNKGVNEGRTLLESFGHFNFNPHDMLIKISGRYHFMSDCFIRFIENNPDLDGAVKSDGGDSAYTLCYALKAHLMLDFLQSLDFEKMEREMICIEAELGAYVRRMIQEKNAKIAYVDRLDVTGLVWGVPGYYPGTQSW
jgi:hypothetical protein